MDEAHQCKRAWDHGNVVFFLRTPCALMRAASAVTSGTWSTVRATEETAPDFEMRPSMQRESPMLATSSFPPACCSAGRSQTVLPQVRVPDTSAVGYITRPDGEEHQQMSIDTEEVRACLQQSNDTSAP